MAPPHRNSARRLPDGGITTHYDPNMVLQFVHHPHDYDQWDAYDRIDVPTLCLRGESSDLLLADTAEEMRRRGPRAVVVTIRAAATRRRSMCRIN